MKFSLFSIVALLLLGASIVEGQFVAQLQQMYADMNGAATWTNTGGWDGTRGNNPCSTATATRWYGVVCTNGVITSLNLLNNGLTGPLSPAVAQVTTVVNLILGNNQITSLPAELGSMPNLQVLYAYGNALTGALPASLGGATSLTKVLMYNNALTGSIPDAWCSLVNLELLDLDTNSLSGDVPSCFSALDSLSLIDLSYNNFASTLPTVLSSMAALDFVSLQGNSYYGAVPDEWASFEPATLDISNNNLGCRMPSWMSDARATTINMAGNHFMCPPTPCPSCVDLDACTAVSVTSVTPLPIPPSGGTVTLTGTNFGFTGCPNVLFRINATTTVPLTVTSTSVTDSVATVALPSFGGVTGYVLANVVAQTAPTTFQALSSEQVVGVGSPCPGDSSCSGSSHGVCLLTGTCSCVNQWEGDVCDTRPPCKCLNDGECDYSNDEENGAGGVCICKKGYNGEFCEDGLERQAIVKRRIAGGAIAASVIACVLAAVAGGVGYFFHLKTVAMKEKLELLGTGGSVNGDYVEVDGDDTPSTKRMSSAAAPGPQV